MPGEPERPPEDDRGYVLREYRRGMMQFGYLGIEFGVALAVGWFLGSWIDDQLDSRPWGMLAVFALAMTAAGRDFVRAIRKARRHGGPGSHPGD